MERILIAGCGAVGSVFGAFLRRAGHDVTLLGRGWHLDAIRAHGLHVDGIWGEYFADGFATATSISEIRGAFDAVFNSVKSYDTEGMVEQVAPLLREGGVAVALQN